jgi:hypothetical protein
MPCFYKNSPEQAKLPLETFRPLAPKRIDINTTIDPKIIAIKMSCFEKAPFVLVGLGARGIPNGR